MEDGIPRGLQHHHKTCCEKGGRRGRQACMVQRWHHRGDVVFRIGGLAYDTMTEMEGTILTVSINNQTLNAMNITQILEDLRYLVQSNMDEQAFQIQRMLADKLDRYKEKGNKYVDENIREIQDLYIEEEVQDKGKGRVEEEEVILIKPYEASELISTKCLSFIDEEIENLLKYMKFVKSPTQTRIF